MDDRVVDLLGWLTRLGARGVSQLEVRTSTIPNAGNGVFTSERVEPGGLLVAIPQAAVMTACKAWQRPAGKAIASMNASGAQPPDELVLWLDMAVGRFDVDHPHHFFLRSLPDEEPTAVGWPQEVRKLLSGTNLGAAVEEARQHFDDLYQDFVVPLQAAHPDLLRVNQGSKSVSTKIIGQAEVAWARGMYYSRRFPSQLATTSGEGATNQQNGELGVMLPLLDVLNHRLFDEMDCNTDKIHWEATESEVSFRASSHGLSAGAECFNSYGRKGNEELLNLYGFAIPENEQETYGLALTLALAPGPDGVTERVRLGPFYIRRASKGVDERERYPQFPTALWTALGGEGVDPSDPDEEDVEVLLATLEHRLAAFTATSERDTHFASSPLDGSFDPRLIYVARYRDSQRLVLEEAVAELHRLLSSF